MRLKRLMLHLLATSLLLSLVPQQASVAAQRQGASCSKLGATSGNLVCKRSSGKLVWLQAAKKVDSIQVSITSQSYIEDGNVAFKTSNQSGLPIVATTSAPSVCKVLGTMIIPISPGPCSLLFMTSGNSKFGAAQRQETLIIRKRNKFEFFPESNYLVSSGTLVLPRYSSAGLPLEYLSQSLAICVARENVVELKSIGICVVTVSQTGDSFTDPIQATSLNLRIMQENRVVFNIPSELSLRNRTYQLSATSSSGLSVIYKSSTPDICSVSEKTLNLLKVGICSVSAGQPGDVFTLPANDVIANVNITAQRSTEDQPDSLSGFQIKPIYVVPSDGEDRKYDINGYIADALTEGNATLKLGIGQEFQIDSIGSDYDIQFFRSSFSRDYLSKSTDAGEELMKEMKIADKFGLNRKNYVFFIDVDGFKYDTACGYAGRPGLISVVAVGPSKSGSISCVGSSLQLKNYVAHTWVHEVFHNLGVEHTTNDPCDMMRGASTNYCSTSWTIDKDRNRYVGSDKQGVNVLSLRVWKGYVDDQNLRASCDLFYSTVSRSDGLRYALCPTGTQVIGALTYCWSSIRSVELQVWKNNAWTSLGEGSHYNEPWGKSVSWKCNNSNYTAPWKQITVTTPGIQKYRWMVNGTESEQFNIIWQN